MKNKMCVFFFFLTGFSLFNFSCKNEPIFAAIEEEVKLKKQSIQGLVLGIIKIGNTVYSANPKNVFKKLWGIEVSGLLFHYQVECVPLLQLMVQSYMQHF